MGIFDNLRQNKNNDNAEGASQYNYVKSRSPHSYSTKESESDSKIQSVKEHNYKGDILKESNVEETQISIDVSEVGTYLPAKNDRTEDRIDVLLSDEYGIAKCIHECHEHSDDEVIKAFIEWLSCITLDPMVLEDFLKVKMTSSFIARSMEKDLISLLMSMRESELRNNLIRAEGTNNAADVWSSFGRITKNKCDGLNNESKEVLVDQILGCE